MIKNLVVNGCSYTAHNPGYQCWAECLQEKYQFEIFKNLAIGGAGNSYIAQSTIDFLQSEQLDPTETLVLIMWSGMSRLDYKISQQSWQLIQNSGYQFAPQHWYDGFPNDKNQFWVFSGGFAGGSWRHCGETRKIFEPIYKNTNNEILSQMSWNNFYLLESYLLRNQYIFLFTSFINQWTPNKTEHLNSDQNFSLEHWKFVDSEKNCFGEYAAQINEMDRTHHPTARAHSLFSQSFFEPIVEEYLK